MTTTSLSSSFQMHPSFGNDIMDRYDGFILDQFGVMHNGKVGLDGGPECVAELRKRGKKLIILSNSSSLSSATVTKLPKLGYNPSDFVGAVTSGQEACHYIQSVYASSGEGRKKKALFITWKSDNVSSPMTFIQNCGNDIQITDVVDDADFILLHGAEVLRGPSENDDEVVKETSLGSFYETGDTSVVLDPLLTKCVQRKLPMVCCNPDYIMVKPDGGIAHMPGKIAKRYEELGGTNNVTVFGKPHVQHFRACLRDLNLPPTKVAHVGDSLHHDIVGANNSGIDSIFVTGGVHREELGSAPRANCRPKRHSKPCFNATERHQRMSYQC